MSENVNKTMVNTFEIWGKSQVRCFRKFKLDNRNVKGNNKQFLKQEKIGLHIQSSQ